MDPNRTLAFLIEWATGADPADDAISAAEHLLALDRWLRSGGFPPARWQPTTLQLCETLLTALRDQQKAR